MAELNHMMSQEDLPRAMQVRLREYLQETAHVRRIEQRAELLELMSPHLRAEVAWEVNHSWIQLVWFLEGASRSFLVQLSLRLTPEVFSPGEVAFPGRLYIVHRGVAFRGGKVYGMSSVWGEDMILAQIQLQKPYCARAMTFLSTLSLNREELFETSAYFPLDQRRIRKHAVRLATRRAFLKEAARRVQERRKNQEKRPRLVQKEVRDQQVLQQEGAHVHSTPLGADADAWGEVEEMLAITAANASLVYRRRNGRQPPSPAVPAQGAAPSGDSDNLAAPGQAANSQPSESLLESLQSHRALLKGVLEAHDLLVSRAQHELQERLQNQKRLTEVIAQQQAEITALRKRVQAKEASRLQA